MVVAIYRVTSSMDVDIFTAGNITSSKQAATIKQVVSALYIAISHQLFSVI